MKSNILIALLLITSIISMAQSTKPILTEYDKLWQKVEKFTDKNATKDAVKLIETIIVKARTENNTAEKIKAICIQLGIAKNSTENETFKAIAIFKKELASAKNLEVQIWHSLLADIYFNHYQQNKWDVLERTKLQTPSTDLNQWNAQQYFDAVTMHYQASISDKEILKKTPTTAYNSIIKSGTNTDNIYKTMYEVLLDKAIKFYSNDEIELIKPAYAFNINAQDGFADATQFMNNKLQTSDTNSCKYHALKLYQELLQYYTNSNNTDGLIDADIKRLEYVLNHTNGLIDADIKRLEYVLNQTNDSKKNKMYLDALDNIYNKYPTNKYAINAKLIFVEKIKDDVDERNYFSYGNDINTFNTKLNRRLEAKNICENILKTAKDSANIKIAKNLLSSITYQELKLITEKTYIPNENILANICYRNCNKMYCYILPMKYQIQTDNDNQEEEKMEQILAKCKKIAPIIYNLPNSTDLLNHSTDINLGKLAQGHYQIIITNTTNFNDKNIVFINNQIQVSNIAYYILKQQYSEHDNIVVVNRKTGAPIVDANIQFYNYQYNNKTNRSTYKLASNAKANNSGMLIVNSAYNNAKIEITAGTDKYYSDDNNYFSEKQTHEDKPNYELLIFTDRNIYRPNQTIYFKAIYFKKNDSSVNYETQLMKNSAVEIIFNDANGQKISTKLLKTNEYGSIADSFKIPEGLLGGSFSISNIHGSINVQVEEYKRPKFEIIIDENKDAVALNKTVMITGMAKAYAGNGLSDATVTYSIKRRTRLIYDWCRWGNWRSNNKQMQIANGTLKTDADGKYNFSFIAIPDDEMDRKNYPIFDYEISIDVVDINGETHNKTTTISVGYQSIQLSADVPEKIKAEELKTIGVNTKNMNGNFVASDVSIVCYALQNDGTNKKPKLWRTPDQFIMSKSEFEINFATEEYTNETDYKNWKKGKILFAKKIKTTENGIVPINQIPNEDAYILLEISTIDVSGDTLIEKKYCRILKNTNAKPIANEPILLEKDKNDYSINIALPNTAKHIMQVQVGYKRDAIATWKTEKQLASPQEFTINAKDKNGVAIHYGYFANNRFYNGATIVRTQKPINEIKIGITTFRDKLTPGSAEKWIVNITNQNKETVEAELLTSMYDASLDALYTGDWQNMNTENYDEYSSELFRNTQSEIVENSDNELIAEPDVYSESYNKYDELVNYYLNNNNNNNNNNEQRVSFRAVTTNTMTKVNLSANDASNSLEYNSLQKKDNGTYGWNTEKAMEGGFEMNHKTTAQDNKSNTAPPTIRKNFQETAFWFPQLHTDKDGNISFTFTTPDALTKWRWRMLAHTQNTANVQEEKYITTQKELMVVTNNTRFFRADDEAIYTGKVVNTSTKTMSGFLELNIANANTETDQNAQYNNTKNKMPFTLNAGESVTINFPINVPNNDAEPILLKMVATAKANDGSTYSDGEQNAIPVLVNSMLVTESKAFAVRGGQTKQVSLPNLINTNETQQHYNYTIETTANPTWYAVQSLPYLAEFPYECAEQTFSRFFAHKIGNHILNSNPLITKVLEAWRITDTNALLSNLEKNQELKSVLLQETPWLLQAKNETEQKHQLALLLDLKTSAIKSKQAYDKLATMQTPEGGFTWFPGMNPDAFITQYILTGFGKLMHLNIIDAQTMDNNYTIVANALAYTDREIVRRYNDILKQKAKAKAKKQVYNYSSDEMQYLYMRSFYNQQSINAETKKAIDFYIAEVSKNIFQQSILVQAMGAMVMHRFGKQTLANDIVKGIQQNAITTDEDGMYWKANTAGYYWHQAPIETQSVLIECFEEITHDKKSIDEMKIWLLKNKQTHNWATTKATADAVYAMLLRGNNFLATSADLQIKVGAKQLNMQDYPAEAGTGYTKIHFAKNAITNDMGNIQVSNANEKSAVAWGAVYYQYFENLKKIKNANGDIQLEKKLMILKNTSTGEVLQAIPNTGITIGEKIRVRIVLTINRSMDYVHLKDMRGACFEPINVISSYKYNNGLGYYESTKDVATHFFFDHINKGTYVFEYDLFATNKGTYSNGIANIECMYAPEFSGHSEGVKVVVR